MRPASSVGIWKAEETFDALDPFLAVPNQVRCSPDREPQHFDCQAGVNFAANSNRQRSPANHSIRIWPNGNHSPARCIGIEERGVSCTRVKRGYFRQNEFDSARPSRTDHCWVCTGFQVDLGAALQRQLTKH